MSTPTVRRRRAPSFHRVTVSDVTTLTPRMRGITFTGDDLSDYLNDGPGTHCKLLLPADGQREVALPSLTDDGLRWPTDQPRPIMRTYTPRLIDCGNALLILDFALHPDAGPASAWAATAVPGDSVVVTGGRGAYRIDPGADWTVLVADETALPAVATILEDARPGHRVALFAEVVDAAEQLTLATAADLSTTWLHRGTTSDPVAGRLAASALTRAPALPGAGRFWVGLEATAMREIRRHLLNGHGVDRNDLHTRGYWKYGTTNHPDHDTGEDD